jgi:carbon monoxide dehydrogenase subunit G
VLIENTFEVPADIEVVWPYLLDVEKVVVCMPGAELTEAIDENNFKGRVRIKLGPVSLAFAGKVAVAERDDDSHRVVLEGSGMEQRGKGRASVTVTTTAARFEAGTRVVIVQDLQVQGQIASMSRGMMQDVSSKLTQQFADCLKKNLSADHAAAGTPSKAAPSATGGAASEGAVASPAADGGPGDLPPGPAPTPPAGPGPAPGSSAPPARAAEVQGLSLLVSALFGALKRAVGRVLGRSGHR